jgi:folate-dependent phosphoribosylglycinamide formyltransferase PurN
MLPPGTSPPVDADCDTGAIMRQCRAPVFRGDSLDDLKARVRAREKEFVVETLGQIAKGEIRLVVATFTTDCTIHFFVTHLARGCHRQLVQ